MIKDFFIKKENIFIFIVALVSIFFVVLGFLFLFFKNDSNNGPKIIPDDISKIDWEKFNSKLLDQKIEYPKYLYIKEQTEGNELGINITEFKTDTFLNYFSNQNQFSIFPSGIDFPLVYGKTRDSEYVTLNNQRYKTIEFLTMEGEVWATVFTPPTPYEKWETRGFIWIQAKIQNREQKCVTDTGTILDVTECNIYEGQKVIYSGKVSEQFLKTGYEIINKNYFK